MNWRNVKTILRQSEESFKAELKAKESQIDALRSGGLSGVVNRQAALYERRMNAVEQIWGGAVISLAPAKAISAWMATINFEFAAKEAVRNTQLREMFKALSGSFDIKSLQTTDASKARPFISPLAWALYSAYASIVFHAVLKMQILLSGIDKDYSDVKAITKLVKVALPHQESYIEKYGPSAFHYLLEELESNILIELGKILQGGQSDKESIERAALIIKESELLRNFTSSPDAS